MKMNSNRMNNLLRKVALATGLMLLGISIFWSQDGFNFNLAGDSGYTDLAVVIAYVLAFSVTVVQFVFSTNFKDLNESLILFGILAYVYSMYTNYQGIVHFQGEMPNKLGASILAFVMDGVPEPLIAWGLMDSASGNFIGNIIKSAMGDTESPSHTPKKKEKFTPTKMHPDYFSSLPKKGKGNTISHKRR